MKKDYNEADWMWKSMSQRKGTNARDRTGLSHM